MRRTYDRKSEKKRLNGKVRSDNSISDSEIARLSHERFSRWNQQEGTEWDFAFDFLEGDATAQRIFDDFAFDRTNPFNWRALLDALLSRYGEAGRTVIWNREKLFDLALDLNELWEKKQNPRWTRKDALAAIMKTPKLKKKYSTTYGDKANSKGLIRRISEAFKIAGGHFDKETITALKRFDPRLFVKLTEARVKSNVS